MSDVTDPGKTLISAFQLMGAAVNAHEREQTPDQLRDALLAEAAEAVPFDHWRGAEDTHSLTARC